MKQLVREWKAAAISTEDRFLAASPERGAAPADPICEINLAAIGHNYNQLRAVLSPRTRVIAVVKADAYGHGAAQVAPYLERHGVDGFAVATVGEGVELREQGITSPIVVLVPVLPTALEEAVSYDLTLSLSSVTEGRLLNRIGTHLGRTVSAHLMVDTGISRGGFTPEELVRSMPRLHALRSLEIYGMWGHFARITPPTEARQKVCVFRELVAHARRFFPLPWIHMASSSAVMTLPESHFSCVRPGLALYGYVARGGHGLNLQPAMRVTAPVVFVKRYDAGTPVSYEGTYVLETSSRIATIRFGYADGFDFGLSNTGQVAIEGRLYPIVGRVTMDQLLLNVGDDPIRPGQRAVLMGAPGPSPLELAHKANSIPHAMLISGGRRVRQVNRENA